MRAHLPRGLSIAALTTTLFITGACGTGEADDDTAESTDPSSSAPAPSDSPSPTPTEEPSSEEPSSQPRPGLSDIHLLTDEDAAFPNGRSDWAEGATIEGDGQAPGGPCQQEAFSALGASVVFQRDFTFITAGEPTDDPGVWFNETIAEFPSKGEAESAYHTVRDWYDDCTPAGAETFHAGPWSDVATRGRASEQMVATYGPVDSSVDGYQDMVYFLDSGIVLAGNRIAVLSQVVTGQDYIWPREGGTPVAQMLPVAAKRLTGS